VSRMKCVVVASSEDTRKLVADSLESLGMEATLLASLGELTATLRDVPMCGILLGLQTSIKASAEEKASTHDLIQLYPHAMFKLACNEILVLGKEHHLEEFVHGCRQFEPRTIRKSPRTIKHLAVYLSAEETLEDDTEEAVTLNISAGGSFVNSVREWSEGDRVWRDFSTVMALLAVRFAGGDRGATTKRYLV
jgi:hypothetical protein